MSKEIRESLQECLVYAKATTKVYGKISDEDMDLKVNVWSMEFASRGFTPHQIHTAFRRWCSENAEFPEFKNILDMINPPREQLYVYLGPDQSWAYERLTADHPLVRHKLQYDWSPHSIEKIDMSKISNEDYEYAVGSSKRASEVGVDTEVKSIGYDGDDE